MPNLKRDLDQDEKVEAQAREALTELHGMAAAGIISADEERITKMTADAYGGWDKVDYLQRALTYFRKRRRTCTKVN